MPRPTAVAVARKKKRLLEDKKRFIENIDNKWSVKDIPPGCECEKCQKPAQVHLRHSEGLVINSFKRNFILCFPCLCEMRASDIRQMARLLNSYACSKSVYETAKRDFEREDHPLYG